MVHANVDSAGIALLRDLRQHRAFAETPVPEEALHAILEVARWSGSSQNSQPWQFLVIRDRARIARISDIAGYTSFLGRAPLVIVPAMRGRSARSEAYDEGRVTERIMLAARAVGLVAGFDWWKGDDVLEAVKRELAIPDDYNIRAGIGIGYPAPTPAGASTHGGRKPLTELVHYETYGQREA